MVQFAQSTEWGHGLAEWARSYDAKHHDSMLFVFIGFAAVVIGLLACLLVILLGFIAKHDVALFLGVIGALALAVWVVFVTAAVTKWAWKTLF